MRSHAPGPWGVSFPDSGACVVFSATDGARVVASLPEHTSFPDVRVANANLISAAPDLLEAARFALRTLEVHVGEAHPSVPGLRAAIAKAEGREP